MEKWLDGEVGIDDAEVWALWGRFLNSPFTQRQLFTLELRFLLCPLPLVPSATKQKEMICKTYSYRSSPVRALYAAP